MEEGQVETWLLANRQPHSESGRPGTVLSSHPRCWFCNSLTTWKRQGCISSRTSAEKSPHSELPITKGGLCVCRAQDARPREICWNAGDGFTKDTRARQPARSWSTRNIELGSPLDIPVRVTGSDQGLRVSLHGGGGGGERFVNSAVKEDRFSVRMTREIPGPEIFQVFLKKKTTTVSSSCALCLSCCVCRAVAGAAFAVVGVL